MDTENKEKAAAFADATATDQAAPESAADLQHVKAQAWRTRLGLSRPQLAALTGYSHQHIAMMEKGITTSGTQPRPESWQRYRLTCATVELNLKFDWTAATLEQPLSGYDVVFVPQNNGAKRQGSKSLAVLFPSLSPKIIDEAQFPVSEQFSVLEPQSNQDQGLPTPEAN